MPSDVTSAIEGAPAAFVDPALAGMPGDAELVWRRAGRAEASGWGSGGLAGVLPVGPLSLGLAYERAALFGGGPTRISGLLSCGSPRWRLGIAVRRLWLAPQASAVSTDLSLAVVPTTWLRVSAGVDSLLAPPLGARGGRVARTARAGFAVRPFVGAPSWMLAVDAHVPWMHAAPSPSGSAMLVAPLWPGLECLAGGRIGDGAMAFVGVRAGAGGIDAELSGQAWGERAAAGADQRISAQARLRQAPRGPRLLENAPEVRFVLPEDLRPAARWPWQAREPQAPLAVRLHDIARTRAHRRVVLEMEPLEVGLASVESLIAAIGALREQGIEVEARLLSADARTFAVAAACSRVVLDATGELDLTGFASSKWFWAEALGRLGIRMDAISAGEFKTGADGCSRSGPRPEEAANRQPILQAADALVTRSLLEHRGLSEDAAQAARTEGLLCAERALALGLIDAIGPQVDVGRGSVALLPAVAHAPPARRPHGFAPSPAVVVVPVRGVLGGEALASVLGETVDEEAIERALAQAAHRPEVIGVVLQIDSPGGDALSAERLWRAVRRLAVDKPVVATLGDVAASGGYYVAVATSRIWARPATITGSIGVYRLQPDFSGVLSALGIVRDVREAGPHAQWRSLAQPLSEPDRDMLARQVQQTYAHFWTRVAAARHFRDEQREQVAGGRVWLGEAALGHNLIDALGDESDAIDWLAARAGCSRAALSIETATVHGFSWPSPAGHVKAETAAVTAARALLPWLASPPPLALLWPPSVGL